MTPRVRRDLDIISTRPGEFLLSDGRNETAFAVSANERYLCGLLDGTRTPQEVIDSYRERFKEALTRRNLEEFVEQLRVHDLLEEAGEGASARRPVEDGPEHLVVVLRYTNADRLNRVLDLLLVAFGWLLHPISWAPVAASSFFATVAFVEHASLYLEELTLLAAALPLPVVVASVALRLFVVDFARTVVRAMALRKHGARLESFDLALYRRVLPVLACEPGHSVARLDARGRNAQLTSRIGVELALGSLAVLGWLQADWGSFARQFCLVLTIPVCVGLALQLNPFVRLDAYWMLARWLDRPDLYEHARAQVRAWILGRVGPEALSTEERVWIRLYGLGTYLWTAAIHLLVLIGGVWLLTALYGRAGVYWLGLLAAVWYGSSIRRGLGRVSAAVVTEDSWVRGGGQWFVRWPARLVLLGLLVLVGFVPYSHEIVGDARVVPAAERGVRAQVTGEITEVRVGEGDWVSRGTVLVKLTAREVVAAIASTEAELARATANLQQLEFGPRWEEIEIARHEVDRLQSELEFHELRLYRKSELLKEQTASPEAVDEARRLRNTAVHRLALAQKELEHLLKGTRQEEIRAARAQVAYFEAQLDKHRQDLALTEIRAPISGRVSTPHLEERVGQVAQKGDLILVLQDTSDLRFEIAADEEAAARAEPGMKVKVRLQALDGSLLMGRVESVAQLVSHGKSVNPNSVRSDRELFTEETRERDTDEYRFRVVARLEDELPQHKEAPISSYAPDANGPESFERVVAGMTGEARIVVGRSVLWTAMLRPIVRFVRTEVWAWLP